MDMSLVDVTRLQVGEQQGIDPGTIAACLHQPLSDARTDIDQKMPAATLNQGSRAIAPWADNRTTGSQKGHFEWKIAGHGVEPAWFACVRRL